MEHFDRLLDPDEWSHGIKTIQSIVDLPVEKTGLNETIEELIIKPLENYIQAEWEKAGKQHNTGTQAALNLLGAAEDIVFKLEHHREVYPEYLSILNRKWQEWQAIVGFCGWLKAQPFTKASSQPRSDSLKNAMTKTLEELVRQKGKFPTARELWNAVSVVGDIQEKDDEIIYWKRANGTEESTPFKSFQNRYTRIKKEIQKK